MLGSLQCKSTALLACVAVVAVVTGGAVFLHVASRTLYKAGASHCESFAAALAAAIAEPVAEGDAAQLRSIIQSCAAEPSVLYLAVVDSAGRSLAAGGNRMDLFRAGDDLQPAASMKHVSPAGKTPRPPKLAAEPRSRACRVRAGKGETPPYVETSVPVVRIRSGKEDDLPNPQAVFSDVVGRVELGLSLAATERRVARVANLILVVGAGLVVLVVPLGMIIVRRVVSPINQLGQAARHIARGKFDVRVPVHRRDEIGQLAVAFNIMADELCRSQNKLLKLNAELEDRIRRRTGQLRELAARDPLTGLYNRRSFNEELTRRFAEAGRYGSDLSVVMMDLDDLKQINDMSGHRSGDRLLILAANTISDELRASDMAARFGGDEFTVLLPRTGAGEAAHLAKRIGTRFRENCARRMPEATAGLSGGVASLGKTGADDPEALLAAADRALYEAKEAGKNRVAEAGPPGEAAMLA